jgi:ABC-type sugar transport system ATPase subunit
MNQPLLKLEQIDTFYGQVQVHFGVSLDVPRGEIVSLLGGNASGKSTAMKIILGLHRPMDCSHRRSCGAALLQSLKRGVCSAI